MPKTQSGPGLVSLISIIGINLIPLAGVLFYGWNIANVVILYWLENLVLGFWNIPRILLAGVGGDWPDSLFQKLFTCVFFTIHYGIFCIVHGFFIVGILGISSASNTGLVPNLINPAILLPGVIYGTLILFITTGINLYFDYISNKDYKNWTTAQAMFSPYGNIIIIHVAIIASAFLAIALGQPIWLLALVVMGKTILEIITKGRRTKPKDSPARPATQLPD